MGNTAVSIQKITFDVSDEQMTTVTVEAKWEGEYLAGTKSRYEKSFPARFSALELLQNEVPKYLEW